jgi:hypothetical protein
LLEDATAQMQQQIKNSNIPNNMKEQILKSLNDMQKQ